MDKTTTQAQQATPAPTERTVQQKFLRIMELAMQLNSTPTKKAETGDKPTVFVDFSGRTSELIVSVYSRGWGDDRHYDARLQCDINGNASDLWRTKNYAGDPCAFLTVDQMIKCLEDLVAKWCDA
ncbi:hypothetical protein [Allofournierella sp.]|uniref:hypothetical protein n=1 Tax=Allofournierella sp. TaxID=1940256 RepID=UPI003AF05960